MNVLKNIRYISNKHLAVSEPNPMWFGNQGNEPSNKAWTNKNWLKSRFHFSFAEYYNPSNTNFGVLRVMNDDLVQPERGFGAHPHRNAEIVTYVVDGKLTHQDSMGTKESLGRGSIQFMTAGKGVVHSEHNLEKQPLRFIQMWLNPSDHNLAPKYGSMCGSKIDSKNKLGHMVSSVGNSAKTPVKIHCDANIYAAELDDEKTTVSFNLVTDRQAYFLAVEGSPTVQATSSASGKSSISSQKFAQHDAAELYGDSTFTVSGPGHILLVEMEKDKSGGRGDLE
mmetsp:Transcript_4033/g.6404  ORF Transcript_4033/g.6404 Transcript_4033/m.6404 type:complete len:281 (-) Transcript_4033:130-972(-)